MRESLHEQEQRAAAHFDSQLGHAIVVELALVQEHLIIQQDGVACQQQGLVDGLRGLLPAGLRCA